MHSGDPLAAMRANLRAFYRLLGSRSPGGSVLERGDLLAAVVPSCPNRSFVNAVVYEHADALADAYEEIASAYERDGVRAWTVWVPEGDRSAAAFLESAGHLLDASPRAMTLDLTGVEVEAPPGLERTRTNDVGALAALNEEAYGWQAGEFAEAMAALAGDLCLYLARDDGEPTSCLGTLDADSDCGIYLVATAERARGRGLATLLLRQALYDARGRGCTTSSLQATKAGFPIYARIGYRDECALDMWERRRR